MKAESFDKLSKEIKMNRGGSRPGSGRPPGARNKRTAEIEAATAQAAAVIEAALGEPFTGDAHALLMTIYKDEAQPIDLRLEAAKAAIRYEKPALAAVDVSSTNEHAVYAVSSEPLTEEEWEARYCQPTQ